MNCHCHICQGKVKLPEASNSLKPGIVARCLHLHTNQLPWDRIFYYGKYCRPRIKSLKQTLRQLPLGVGLWHTLMRGLHTNPNHPPKVKHCIRQFHYRLKSLAQNRPKKRKGNLSRVEIEDQDGAQGSSTQRSKRYEMSWNKSRTRWRTFNFWSKILLRRNLGHFTISPHNCPKCCQCCGISHRPWKSTSQNLAMVRQCCYNVS